jgi:hypothetical protein
MKNFYARLNFIVLTILTAISLNLKAQAPVYFDPQACEATLGMNDSAVVHSILRNMSDDTVEFYFPGYTSKGQGGPDDFGYSWIDSEEDGGPAWEWVDISETGTAVEGLGDDQCVGPFEIGFDFLFYGQAKNLFWISSNGVISFNDQFIPFANGAIPTNNNYIDFIAWFWDDLMIDTAISNVYIQHYEEKTVIQFHRMVHYPGTESCITGQVILMINGKIFFRYRMLSETFEVTGATVGLQSSDPSVGLQVVYNAEYVHSELAVRFDLNRNFITSVTPSSLTLPPGTQETIWITYSSEGFEVGSYEQELKCVTSLPDYPHLLLHNVMHVINENQAGFKGYVTDAVTGYAINDVLVNAGDHQTYTNNNGYYELPLDQGSYNVHFVREGYQPRIVEDTTALPGYSILDVTLEPLDPNYFLVGRVYAGDNYLETGFAYGYKMLEGTVVDVYAEMVGGEGWYEFTGLSPADYIVKAEPSPNSVYYGDYLPTYYGDVLHWEEATIIHLTQNTDGAHIHLIPVVSAPQGPGSISGTIENSGRTADVPIILRAIDPASAVMTLSNADGSFAFNNLDYGTYEIFAEIPGKSIIPMTIALDATTPSKENVDMLVVGNEIVFLGIVESEMFETLPYIYPNPVKDRINIALNLKKHSKVSIEILDPAGRLVVAESYEINGKEDIGLDVTNLPKGIYLMKMEAGEEVVVRRIIKE